MAKKSAAQEILDENEDLAAASEIAQANDVPEEKPRSILDDLDDAAGGDLSRVSLVVTRVEGSFPDGRDATGYLTTLRATDLQDLASFRGIYGGGKYQVQVRRGGRYLKSITFKIPGFARYDDAQQEGRLSGSGQAGGQAAPAFSPLDLLNLQVQAEERALSRLKAMAEIFQGRGDGSGGGLQDQIALLREMREMIREEAAEMAGLRAPGRPDDEGDEEDLETRLLSELTPDIVGYLKGILRSRNPQQPEGDSEMKGLVAAVLEAHAQGVSPEEIASYLRRQVPHLVGLLKAASRDQIEALAKAQGLDLSADLWKAVRAIQKAL